MMLHCYACLHVLTLPYCGRSKQVRFSLMSPGEVVKTGELNVYQGQLFHVSGLQPLTNRLFLPHAVYTKIAGCCTRSILTETWLAAGRQEALCWWPTRPPLGMHMSGKSLQFAVLRQVCSCVHVTLLQGISTKQALCQTCGQKLTECTGHFGMSPARLVIVYSSLCVW